jgi:L-seryl-tRNA(Ser) seleniumtransferase
VDQVLLRDDVSALAQAHGRELALRELRVLLDDARSLASQGDQVGLSALLGDLGNALAGRLARAVAPSLRTVINATGVVVHTNLGRAPLSYEAARRVAEVAQNPSNLEYDLLGGGRGNREAHAETRLCALLNAEATAVVNNNAAALLLAVNTLAEGRQVLVSRGELVEIGGSFRIPDILKKGGASLVEVGTTNRTRLSDYRAALGPKTGLLLKVHQSNFRIQGFTEEVGLEQLVALSRETGVPLVHDLGGGLLDRLPPPLDLEPTVGQSLKAGVDVVSFSGDKLLGGPQAGLLAGLRGPISAMRQNPLYRALRVDKMTMAALDAVLGDHQAGRAEERVPVRRMLALPASEIRARAEALATLLRRDAPSLVVEITPGASAVGGGAAPMTEIPTFLLTLRKDGLPPDQLAAAFRRGTPPLIVRVADDRVVLDLRTVSCEDDARVAEAIAAGLR